MNDERPDVTDTELQVLRHLWDHGASNRRQITDALYPEGGPAHYTTVQKLLERLEAKGFVRSQMDGAIRIFTALVPREQLIRQRLRDVAEKLCDGSLTPLLTNLVDADSLSADEIAELRAWVRKLGNSSTSQS
jgi:predicted transcriptional regulator